MSTPDDRRTTFAFRPLARTVVMLGEQLISDEVVAVTELVKNCYDADGDRVTIVIDRTASRLRIIDTGCGMSLEDILNKWLVPATASKGVDDKGRKCRTRGGRIPIGGKGIGRFAVQHLGHSLELATRTENDVEELVLRINWDDYDKPDVYLDEVHNECFRRVPQEVLTVSGTVLTISRLKSDWDEPTLASLRDGLGKLFSSSKGFTITLTVDGVKQSLPQGRDRYLAQLADIRPEWALIGQVDAAGNFLGTLNKETLSVYLHADREAETRNVVVSPGPFKVELYVIEQKATLNVKQDARARSIVDLRKEINGVLIYRDGCRIYPYGNPGIDWLGLDKRRISDLGDRLSYRQVVAFVDITQDDNPLLVDKTNREGFLENGAFEALRGMLLKLITEVESARLRQKKDKERKRVERQPISKLFENLQRDLPVQVKPKVKELQKVVVEEIRHKEDRVRVMAELSGIGLAAEKATHEINHTLDALLEILDKMSELVNELSSLMRNEVLSTSDPRLAMLRRVGMGLTRSVFEMKDLFRIHDKELKGLRPLYKAARGTEKWVDVSAVATRALGWYEKAIAGADIRATIDVLEPLTVEINEGLLLQVFMNLIDNAVYWLKRVYPPRHLTITVNGNLNCIYVSDNGPGIKPGEEDIIFEPLVSRKEEGRGLGLYIVRELLEKQGHGIGLSPVNERIYSRGAEFKVTFALESRLGG